MLMMEVSALTNKPKRRQLERNAGSIMLGKNRVHWELRDFLSQVLGKLRKPEIG